MKTSANQKDADSLFNAKQYFEASIAYERLAFQTDDQSKYNVYRFNKSLCYKQLGNYDRAIDELQRIYFTNAIDTLYRNTCYELSVCYYLIGEPNKALWKIDEYMQRSNDTALNFTFFPIRILSLNALFKWEEARKNLIDFIGRATVSEEEKAQLLLQVDGVYRKKFIPKIKSIKTAENWSRFIPGSGQMYAGKTGEGLINMLIHSSLLAFSAHQFYYGFYITGYFAGLGFFHKMYQGGIKRAGILAEQRNEEELKIFNHKIVNLLQTSIPEH